MKKVLLYSGGMDSLIAWHYLGEPQCMHAEIGNRGGEVERALARVAMSELEMSMLFSRVLKMDKFEESDANIPMRNLYLSMLAVSELVSKSKIRDDESEGIEVYMISQLGETSTPDRSQEFMSLASSLLTMLNGGLPIKISSPFMKMTKVDMVEWYVKNVQDEQAKRLRRLTVGCFSPIWTGMKGDVILHCGECPACFRRRIAFAANDVDNSGEYARNVLEWRGVQNYIDVMLADKAAGYPKYGERRVRQTLDTLIKLGISIEEKS